MKKIIAMMVLSLFVLSFVGCGNGNDINNQVPNPATPSSQSQVPPTGSQVPPPGSQVTPPLPSVRDTDQFWSSDRTSFDLPAYCAANDIELERVSEENFVIRLRIPQPGNSFARVTMSCHAPFANIWINYWSMDDLSQYTCYASLVCSSQECYEEGVVNRDLLVAGYAPYAEGVPVIDLCFEGATAGQSVWMLLLDVFDEVMDDAYSNPFLVLPYGNCAISEWVKGADGNWSHTGIIPSDGFDYPDLSTYR